MPTPAYQRIWTQNLTLGRPGTRIPYTNVTAVMTEFLYGVTNYLGSNGLTIQFSSNSVTAGAGNNIVAPANWVRGATAAAAQSWMLFLDGNGGQLLVAYTGATVDAGYIGYSPTAAFIGTGSTVRPTATDEIPLTVTGGASLVATTTSGDRVWHAAISADAKAYRVVVCRQYVNVGWMWGVDNIAPIAAPTYVTMLPPVVAWSATGTIISEGNWNGVGQARLKIASVNYLITAVGFSYLGIENVTDGRRYLPQGGAAWAALPVILTSPFSSFGTPNNVLQTGILGNGIDLYLRNPSQGPVNEFGDLWSQDGGWWMCGALLWPNPSGQPPMIA